MTTGMIIKYFQVTSFVTRISYLLIIFFIAITCNLSCGRKKEKNMAENPPSYPPAPPKPPSMVGSDTIWNFSDQTPILPGNKEALFAYIGRNLQYPDSAKRNGVQGKVIVKFCVTSKGNVTGHEVTKSLSPDLDAEALRVIKTITRFEPGYNDGKAVTVYFEVPISFVLK